MKLGVQASARHETAQNNPERQAVCAGAGINLLVVHYREKGRLATYLEEHLLPILKKTEVQFVGARSS